MRSVVFQKFQLSRRLNGTEEREGRGILDECARVGEGKGRRTSTMGD